MDLIENDWDTLNEVVDEVNSGLKTEEEIEKFVIDESLSDLERAKTLLTSGHAVQFKAAIDNLPALYRAHKNAAHEVVHKPIEKAMKKPDPEDSMALAAAFRTILEEAILSPKELSEWLLPTVTSAVTTNRDDEVVVAWLGVLIPMVPHLAKDVVSRDVLKLALAKGEVAETVQSRGICCRLLGTIAPHIDRQLIMDTFFHKSMALCQDTDYQVRICMAQQLEPIARAVGAQTTIDKVIPEAMELLNDEESSVQAAALESVVGVLDMFPREFRREKVVPIIKEFVHNTSDEVMAECVAAQFGRIIGAVAEDLTDPEVADICGVYCELARSPEEELRIQCAAGAAEVAKSLGAKRFFALCYDALMEMAQDRSPIVKGEVARGLLPLGKAAGKALSAQYLRDPFMLLLEDGAEEVSHPLLENLVGLLGLYEVAGEAERERVYEDILPALLAAQGMVGARDWRHHKLLIEAFKAFPDFFSSDAIFDHVVPLCFKYMQEGVQPVKDAAAKAVCVLMRRSRRQSNRREICHRIVRELGRGQSFWDRALYVTCCGHIMELCSSRFFKEMFLDACFDALADPVANVRMRSVSLLPGLKRSVKLPDDVEALDRINNFFNSLQEDKDRDVLIALDRVEREYKAANSQQAGRGPLSEWQRKDRGKEEEESEMLVREAEDNKKRFEEKQK
eukprot:CAMPEP_0182900592 /NCGR_PEP_ID=MMETSP0034_2-20130328/28966_1 /TAXON_ID=156128 /ORGANISM="Nephroselmis pyriformis, Strain CCMP717" /LENGTH=678 /DNA_ID=CAMNT_0025034831 /DNA_START=313 /DNA_END=2346 /DNA_ORIENTATION=+